MKADQARQLVRETFTHAFDKARFRAFIVNLLNHVDETKSFARNTSYIKDAFKPHVQRFERLGTYTSPDKEVVDVLIVSLTDESKLERTRTAIRNFVADHLRDRDQKDAALVAFVSPSEKQWRFSYVKMEYAAVEKESGKVGVETRLTPARRFSYMVGEGESCHTAQIRFLEMLQDTSTDPTLSQIEEAFSVEAVTKEFFGKYAELFGDINAALEKMVGKDKTLRDEFTAKGVKTVDFAKKLMGQIVFLYFLQKKGWLGVEKGKDWGTGPRDFLRRMADGACGKYENFFNDILEPLFYDTLATDRGHDAWCTRFKCRIPFLNGGLFEPHADYDWKKTDILIPNKLFTNNEFVEEGISGTGVLDVFDRYNFTVNEAEPLEKDVAIDPEMLGKVFENLIEENRRKGLGAFYTPREIVHYMCQESLINYLDTAVTGMRADIETFVRLGEQISHYEAVDAKYAVKMPKSIEKNAKPLDDALKSITVCDPAVGSGAFPVGMMTEIVRARAALTPYFNDEQERTAYHFKRDAIQNSLYGVDIDSSAVEIAKLRLWLSLVVDEEDVKQVKPLPNLDYKIVVGNSLIELLSVTNLYASADAARTDLVNRLKSAKDQMFNLESKDEKRSKREEIEHLLQDLFEHDRKKQLEVIGQRLASIRAQGQLFEGGSRKEQGVIDDLESSMEEIRNIRMPKPSEHFEWGICFSEVFQKRQGFDVVIANPPYIQIQKFARTAQQEEWKRQFKTYAGAGDIYCLFYERGLKLLRDDGVLTFITSNKFQRAGYGKALRLLLASQRIRALVDFCELPVFVAATDPMIVVINKSAAPADHEIPVVVIKDEGEFESLAKSLASRGVRYRPEQLKADGWSLESSDGLVVVEKLRMKGTPLSKYVNGRFYRGVLTGLNEAFVIDRATRDRLIREDRRSVELIKPWIRGKDIKRWTYEFNNLWLLFIRHGVSISAYPAIEKHLNAFKKALSPGSKGGRKPGNYKWYEIQDSIDYWKAFDEPKIVFNETSKRLHAYLDTAGNAINKTGFIILAPDAPYVLAVLNSTPLDWLYRSTFPSWGDPWNSGRVQFRGNLMAKVPIPAVSPADKARLTKLTERAEKQAEAEDTTGLRETEREIDEIIYRLFDLTPDEIAHIEKSLINVGRAGPDDNSNGDDEE